MIIDRIFITVLLLSISGFVFCIVFFSLVRYAFRLTSAKTMVSVNTTALFSFVIPFYYVASLLDKSEVSFGKYKTLVFRDAGVYEGIVGKIREMQIVEYISTIWLLGMIVFLVRCIYRYIRLIHRVRANKFHLKGTVWAEIFSRLADGKKISDVSLVGNYVIHTPCTVGIRKQYIVIPAGMLNAFDEEEMEFILKHEIYHVLHKDLPRKFLIAMLSCINWFNPLFWLLKENLSNWQESASDEEVIADFTPKKQLQYSQLLLKVMHLERTACQDAEFGANFKGSGSKKYKRRAMKIMRNKKTTGIHGKAVVAFVTLLSMVSGSVVAKAADMRVNQIFSRNVEVVETSEIEVIEEQDIFSGGDLENRDTLDSGTFVKVDLRDTADTTYEIIINDNDLGAVFSSAQNPVEPQHLHNIIDVTIKKHKKNSDGSCTTTYYEGRQCTICSGTWMGDVIGETNLVKCPH